MAVLFDEAEVVLVPAGALGQAWCGGARQARLARILKTANVRVVPLDGELARAGGELCGRRGTSDLIDATVVLVARQRGGLVATSDPDDLLRLDPSLDLVRC